MYFFSCDGFNGLDLFCFRESTTVFDHLCETFPDENCVLTSREILVEASTCTQELSKYYCDHYIGIIKLQ